MSHEIQDYGAAQVLGILSGGGRMSGPVLSMTGICKRFGSFQVLTDVTLELAVGEVHALLGVNGAGKSTLIKILSGVYLRSSGEIRLHGRPIDIDSPADALAHGIAAVQQHPELAGGLTGYENIFLGREGARFSLLGRFDGQALRQRGLELLKRFPIDIDLDRKVNEMTTVEREVVAVLRALASETISVLILDEPTSILTEREKALLFNLIRALKATGICIVYITHRLEEVFEIADRFTILRGGRNVATLRSGEAADRGLSIAEMMLGEKEARLFPARAGERGDAVLDVSGLRRGGEFQDITFQAHRGEIVGIFGLVGSGVDELAKCLFGVNAPEAGEVRIEGRKVFFKTPADALNMGMFLLPGDRRTEGLTLERDVTFNVTLANLRRASGLGGLMKFADTGREVAALARMVALDPPRLNKPVQTFSGGNQQKIVVAKGLYRQAKVYIFVEPTVGVDLGARSKLYALMRDLSKTAAVIVMSTDSDEVFGIADRVFALYKGAFSLEGMAAGLDRDQLWMAGAMGSAGSARDRKEVQA